jgi:CrcB protein
MNQALIVCVVAASGALGAVARYASTRAATLLLGDAFPYGTLLVNVVGSLVIGLAYAALPEPSNKATQDLWLRYGLMTGFLGAYTTFSSFSLDTLRHFEAGQTALALVNIAANVFICLLAVWAGVRIGQSF